MRRTIFEYRADPRPGVKRPVQPPCRLTPVRARLIPSRPERPHSRSQPAPGGNAVARENVPPDTDEAFKPYIPDTSTMAEFTPRAVLLGMFFGIIFGAVTVYVGLRAGLTVAASIPIAVLSISLLRALGRATILENNIVQTTGSAGESVAGGVIFTLPALIFLDFPLEDSRIFLLALIGGGLVVRRAIKFFGTQVATPIYPSPIPIAQMTSGDLWNFYIRYIGAGAVAAAGLITLLKTLPTIVAALTAGAADLRKTGDGAPADERRTNRDLKTTVVLAGSLLIVALMWGLLTFKPVPGAPTGLVANVQAAVLGVIFGFLFVTVSSRIVGLIGTSSHPISGMAIATLMARSEEHTSELQS